MHEGSLHRQKCFITLTYDEAHLPEKGWLDYRDFQLFMKRTRKEFAPSKVRFYMCGEYGGQLGRPHFHALLFGADFDDKEFLSTLPSGGNLYRSDLLARLWPHGFSSRGDLTFESAAYIARYCVQKITGPGAKDHYQGRPPEFNHGSLRPGIGARFLEKYEGDIYPFNRVVINGKETKPPRYYAKLYKRRSAFAAQLYEDTIDYDNFLDGVRRAPDNTPARLRAKEEVAAARAAFLVRSIE